MLIMDIVNRAVMKSGVVSSFNKDEVPEDIQERAADVLRNEIIPDLNCDRAVDVSETVIPFTPKKNTIDLITPPEDYDGYIIGSVPQTYDELRVKERYQPSPGVDPIWYYPNIVKVLYDAGYSDPGEPGTIGDPTKRWPTDQFGNYRDLFCWTADWKLVCLSKPQSASPDKDDDLLDYRYNVPFYPAYIDEVYRAGDGAQLLYRHHGEMVSAQYRHAQLVFTLEDNITRMTIRFNPCFGNTPVLVVLPVPVTVTNVFAAVNPWEGEIVAPKKFFSFLLNILAFRMATEFNIDTKESMKEQAKISYSNIIKNKVRREHPQDIERRIFNYLRTPNGIAGGRGGYSGGYDG